MHDDRNRTVWCFCGHNALVRLIVLLFVTAVSMAVGSTSVAATGADDSAPVTESRDRAKLRIYPGGKDEQDLKVQVVLPNAPRTNDSISAGAATGSTNGADDSTIE